MPCESLEKFNAVTDRNVLALQEAKSAGKKVVGQYCIYSPLEIALAAGAIPVSLCGTKNDSIAAAETMLPRVLCPLIKSSFGFALQDSCPYLAASDIVVADATCDGKKKMYELLNHYKPVMLLQLPQIQDEDAARYWRGQFAALVARLEKDFNVSITEEKLRDAIRLTNRLRRALKNVLDLARRKPSPLSGMDILSLCFRASFMPDYEQCIALLDDIAAEIGRATPDSLPAGGPRILLTGVPTGMGSHKVIQLLETCGAHVVCIDNCTCYKKVLLQMDENRDPLSELAERYLAMHCSVMSPNPHRYEVLKKLSEEFLIDAVVDLTWQGCQTYDVESWSVKKYVREELRLPFLQIVTDYSETDTEQLKVRIEAFLEMLA
ncbi:MAG: 2-hydroxyacyl-CoA dehydratase family protein [Desulfovibrio sp.]|uniref:double-cubane-cluster-containing anaerobic reductase n=1 Tax=Desulfovibrio sp. TaxID=885 RepID=UPI0025BE2854|nr:double-cubane-cluster-containing anaerobic reductase [Desulfovibrio sp.]MCI7568559.1 2-hydroxyacyl-CoA dehydratase family protein [Desulfovibrio sp.]